jgi:hypothetical protein
MTYARLQATSGPVAESAPMSTTFRLQRTLLAACIILAPLSITLYIWRGPRTRRPSS